MSKKKQGRQASMEKVREVFRLKRLNFSQREIARSLEIAKSTVSKYLKKETESQLSFLEIEIFSSIRSVAGQGASNFAVLDIGSGITKLYIVEEGIVKESHIISRGSQNITLNISRATGVSLEKAERQKIQTGISSNKSNSSEKEVSDIIASNLEYILGEVNKNILNYQRKNNKDVLELIITGGGSVIDGIVDFSKSYLEMNVRVADPFSKVETPVFLEDLLKKVGPGFAVSLGIALRGLDEIE